jgi:hypothetical protein
VSQNAPSLVASKGYADRLVELDGRILREPPFEVHGSYLGLVLALRRRLPSTLVDRLLPVQVGTIGREPALTDWAEESGAPPPQANLSANST